MARAPSDYSALVEARFPGLTAAVRKIIEESERRHDGKGRRAESFLWEHTVHAASIAFQIARAEGMDPLIPVIGALFHDAGKFQGGQYHADDTPEEEQSARMAGDLLRRFGMKPAEIARVLAGLKALYNQKSRKTRVAAVIHDADFLSKFGALGVAEFFIKSTLRRRTLQSAVLGYLSKELTYASCLPLNMQTASGRKLAARKSADSLAFFRSLLAELREARIGDLRIRRLRLRGFDVPIVVSRRCPRCQSAWDLGWSTDKGIKCTKLVVDWACARCGHRLETSFCLPELA